VAKVGVEMQLLVSYLNDWRDAALTAADARSTEKASAGAKREKPEPVGAGS
jgi:hypothetical protein